MAKVRTQVPSPSVSANATAWHIVLMPSPSVLSEVAATVHACLGARGVTCWPVSSICLLTSDGGPRVRGVGRVRGDERAGTDGDQDGEYGADEGMGTAAPDARSAG